MKRVAVVAGADAAALHGLEGRFAWGEGRTFEPGDDELAAWAPDTVIALDAKVPEGAWRVISWAAGDRRVGSHGPKLWRRATLPAADSLAALRTRPGTGVLVVGTDEARRELVLAKLADRAVPARAAGRLTRVELERARVVALLGEAGAPVPDGAAAVLAAGRILVAPQADPAFGLLAWSDHLPYGHEDELACAADAAYSFPAAFAPITAMGLLTVQAHLASAVYGRLALDAELEDAAA